MANFDEEVTPVGRLYKYDSKTLKEEVIIKDVAISNGINWFGDYMYWTSSLEYRIYRFKYDYKSGSIDPSTKEVFVDIPKIFHDRPQYHKGEPDGSTMDQEGNLYAAVWGTNRVIKVNPKGELVHEYILPANQLSCVTIGGPNFDQLFVTSGDKHLLVDDSSKWKSDPNDLGGNIFRIQLESGIKGIAKNKWSGELQV
ncbi:unnamed protein product [Ambrosiozyma monospora]|uniref:Unnamed protein product n=1 Tax=Ambrosiozyma monospora TaxID=43982 RepID=A0A9W6Z2V6_AMBMO|nr:unnamed protein product [Ambrosiozyma monospora]